MIEVHFIQAHLLLCGPVPGGALGEETTSACLSPGLID